MSRRLFVLLALLASTPSSYGAAADGNILDRRKAKENNKYEYDGIDIPEACHELKGNKLDKCMESWLTLSNTTFAVETTTVATAAPSLSSTKPLPQKQSLSPTSVAPASMAPTSTAPSSSPVLSPTVADALSASLPTEIANIMGLNTPPSTAPADGLGNGAIEGATSEATPTTSTSSPITGGTLAANDEATNDEASWQNAIDYSDGLGQIHQVISSSDDTGDSIITESAKIPGGVDEASAAQKSEDVLENSQESVLEYGESSRIYMCACCVCVCFNTILISIIFLMYRVISKTRYFDIHGTSLAASSLADKNNRVVYTTLGNFDMSLTIYSSPRINNRRNHRHLYTGVAEKNDVENYQGDDSLLSRQYELAATKQHLRNVYEQTFPDHPLISLELHFTDEGNTKLSHGIIRYSTFNCTVGFEDYFLSEKENDYVSYVSVVPKAFLGPSKVDFLDMFHDLFLDDDDLEESSSAVDDDITSLYDVSVVQSSSDGQDVPADAATDSLETTSPHSDLVDAAKTIASSENQQQQETSDTKGLIALTVMSALAILLTLVGLAIYIWKKRYPNYRKAKEHLNYAEFDDEDQVELYDDYDDEEKQEHQYDMNAISNIGIESAIYNNEIDEEEDSSNPSSISSNLQEENEVSKLEQPYPLELSSSYLDTVKEQEAAASSSRQYTNLQSDMSGLDNDVASTWSFSVVGKDNESNASPDLQRQDSNAVDENNEEAYNDSHSLGGSSLLRNVNFESVIPENEQEEEDGNKFTVADDEGLFVDEDGGSFIKEILARNDDYDVHDEEDKGAKNGFV